MKKWLLLLMLLPCGVTGTDLYVQWTHTIAATDPNGNVRDTVYSPVLNINQSDWSYYWRTVDISGVDTLFGGDTVYIQTEHSYVKSGGTWTQFDSTKIVLSASLDSTLTLSNRITTDSTAYAGNFWRVKIVNGFSLGATAADTALVGNVYDYDIRIWFEGKP